jgi:hypothetical protein
MRDDKCDRELNAALAKYAAVEPRHGLEERILANLRARRERRVTPNWRGRSFGLAGAALAILAASALWHGATTATRVTQRSAITSQQEVASSAGTAAASAKREDNLKSQMPKSKEQKRTQTFAEVEQRPVNDAPKLEQFPAPQPLSEQEELLVRFVQEDPRDAALVAEARTEQLAREEEAIQALSGKEDSEPQAQ